MTSRAWARGIIAALAAILTTANVRADILVRNDGVPIEGKLVSQSAGQIVFQADGDKPATFDRSAVQRVVTVDANGAVVTDALATTRPAVHWNVPPEPAAPPMAARVAGPTYYVIPLHGEVGVTVLASALEKSLADAVARKATVVVLDIDSPGGLVEEAKKIMEVLHDYNKKTRIVALAGQDLSAAAILSLSCREIYVKATGTIGAAVAYNPANLTLPPKLEEKMQSAWRAVARNSAEEGGHEPLLAEAMIDNSVELHLETVDGKTVVRLGPGDRTICRMGKILTLSSHEAVECGLAAAQADDFAELGTALGTPNWTECQGLARTLADYLPRRAAAFNAELEKVRVGLDQDIQEAIQYDPTRSTVTVVRTVPATPNPAVRRVGPRTVGPRTVAPPVPVAPSRTVTITRPESPANWHADALRCVLALQKAEADLKDAVSLCEAFGQKGQAEGVTELLHMVGDIRARIYANRTPPSVPTGMPTATAAPSRGPALTIPGATKTALLGGPGGSAFTTVSPTGVPVIGFRCAFGEWGGKQIMRQVEPLFDRPAVSQAADPGLAVARDGYVVGGLIVNYDNVSAIAVRVIFARYKEGTVDATSTYTSDWIGLAKNGQTQQLAGHGELVVGTCGRHGMNLDALGLVVLTPDAARDAHRVSAAPAAGTPTAPAPRAPSPPVSGSPTSPAAGAGVTSIPSTPSAPQRSGAAPNNPAAPSVVEVSDTQNSQSILQKTAMVGGNTNGHDFEKLCPNNAPAVGFSVMYGFNNEIRLMDPLCDQQRQMMRDGALARPGYAVAGLIVNTNNVNICAFRVIFGRYSQGVIDTGSTYLSDWVGTPRDGTTTQLAGNGETVIGIYGLEAQSCNDLGLIVIPIETAMNAHRAARAAAAGYDPAPKVGPFPLPDAASQAKALKALEEVYAPYPPSNRIARDDLAAKLLEEGLQTTDDAAQRYVLLREARDMSAQSDDWDTTTTAVKALSASFPVDPVAMWTTLLNQASANREGNVPKRLIAAAIAAAQQAIAADRYDDANHAGTLAETWARKAKDDPALAAAEACLASSRVGQKDYAKFAEAMRQLKEHPTDPNANLTAGRFECFCKGDWARGLPLLARGSDPGLKSIAAADLALPTTKADRVSLGDQWWELSEKLPDAAPRLQARAARWYQQALPEVTAPLQKALLEKRIKAAGPMEDSTTDSVSTGREAGAAVGAPASSDQHLFNDYSLEHGKAVNCMVITPDGKMLISAGDSRIVRLWDLSRRQPTELSHVDDAHSSAILGMALSPDGKVLATGVRNSAVKIWQLNDGQLKERASFTAHLSGVKTMVFSPDGKALVTGGSDGMIFVWDCSGDNPAETMSFRTEGGITALALSPNGSTLAVATINHVDLWDISSKTPVERFRLTDHSLVHSVVFSPNGRVLATGSADKAVRLWAMSESPRISSVLQGSDAVNAIAFSTDGKLVASAGERGDIFVWDTSTGAQVTQKQKAKGLRAAAFRGDNSTAQGEYELAVGSADGKIYLFGISRTSTASARSPGSGTVSVPAASATGAAGNAPAAAPGTVPMTQPDNVPGVAPAPGDVPEAANLLKQMVIPTSARFIDDDLYLPSGSAQTPNEIAVPFRADFVVKVDSPNLSLGYGGHGQATFNFGMQQPGTLRYQDPGRRRGYLSFHGMGALPVNQFVHITWIIGIDKSQLLVDGEERAHTEGNYGNLSARLSVSALATHLTIKSITVVSER